MLGYLVQQGADGACVYWNAKFQSSGILSKDPIGEVKDYPFTLEEATRIRDLWDYYGNHKSTFKVVRIDLWS